MHRENAPREIKKRIAWKMKSFMVKLPPSANPKDVRINNAIMFTIFTIFI